MKTYTKILLVTLPVVFFFIGATIAMTYHFSRTALLDLGDARLSTRLDMAMEITREQEKNIHDYGLENIPASIVKAKQEAIVRIKNITPGNQGFLFIMDCSGAVIFHPDKYLNDTDLAREKWFSSLTDQGGKKIINLSGKRYLVRFGYFAPWEWYVLAADPMDEMYSAINRIQPGLYGLFISAAIIISLVLMFLTARLTRPLKALVSGTQAFGKGNLDTRINIQSDDEFGVLAKEFNQMAFRLQDSLAALKQNEERFKAFRDINKRKQTEQALMLSRQEAETRVLERTRDLQIANKALNNEIQILRQKENELERVNQVKSEFLANVSHEIRTSLNAILGFGELLETMITEKQQVDYLSAINTAGKNLSDLINDILDLSKMEAGKLEINREPVLLKSLFNEIYQLFRINLKTKNLNFFIELPENDTTALALDEMRLRQVFTNLVGNALKFTESGSITLKAQISTSQEDEEKYADLIIQVADTGIGICETQQDKIFKAFEQASAETSRKFGGTGLGLAICKQLIELMGGNLSVSSKLDQGSVFTIFLPGVEKYHTHIPAPAAPKKSAWTNMQFAKERVLIVDDQQNIRFMLREILEKINLDVIEAENGRQALEHARAQEPSLILIDMKMPEIDGVETAACLKADQDLAHIPICLMTAGITLWSKDELESRGFACTIDKPIAIDNLMAVLTRFINPVPDSTEGST